MSRYPKFKPVRKLHYQSVRQPISGYHDRYEPKETYAIMLITGPRCRGFISEQIYSSFEGAKKAAYRKARENDHD